MPTKFTQLYIDEIALERKTITTFEGVFTDETSY